jgi:hypothetical protein
MGYETSNDGMICEWQLVERPWKSDYSFFFLDTFAEFVRNGQRKSVEIISLSPSFEPGTLKIL